MKLKKFTSTDQEVRFTADFFVLFSNGEVCEASFYKVLTPCLAILINDEYLNEDCEIIKEAIKEINSLKKTDWHIFRADLIFDHEVVDCGCAWYLSGIEGIKEVIK